MSYPQGLYSKMFNQQKRGKEGVEAEKLFRVKLNKNFRLDYRKSTNWNLCRFVACPKTTNHTDHNLPPPIQVVPYRSLSHRQQFEKTWPTMFFKRILIKARTFTLSQLWTRPRKQSSRSLSYQQSLSLACHWGEKHQAIYSHSLNIMINLPLPFPMANSVKQMLWISYQSLGG